MDAISLCFFSSPTDGGWCDRLEHGNSLRPRPIAYLLSTCLSNKCCSYDKRAVGDSKRKRSKPPRNWPGHGD